MKNIRFSNLNSHLLILTACTFNISCNNFKKESEIISIQKMSPDVTSALDFNSISYLNEANKKVIDISSMISHQNKSVPHLQLILKIKEDHQRTDRDFKELTKKNLTIIPKPFYQLNLNKDSLNDKNSSQYLVKLLVNEINLEIDLLENIIDTTSNPAYKNFAEKASVPMRQNSQDLTTNFKLN